jgi:hypothetical protein
VHEDIAHLIGTVRVVVNRLINRFKHEGIIYNDKGLVRIMDLEHLLGKADRRVQVLHSIHQQRSRRGGSERILRTLK